MKDRLSRLVIFACLPLIGGLHASPAGAATEALEQAVLNTFNWATYVTPLEERKKTALAMQAYWQNFHDRIPSLTPAEREWLSEEFKKTGEPLSRLFRSEIFAISQLIFHTENCYDYSTSLIQSQNASLETEMFFWTKMVKCYTNNDLLIYLSNSNLSNGRADGQFRMQHSSIINNRILDAYLPSAMADVMGWTLDPED